MIPVSKEFKEHLKNDERNYIIEIDMVLHDGTKLKLDNSDIWDSGVSFEESTSSTGSFDIGAAVIGKCTLVLNNIYDKFSEYDFFGATFTLYIGLELSEKKEMIRKGFYTVDEPKYNGSIITLECLDNMWKFDVPYSEVKTSYPSTLGVIVADICLHCGVSLGKANFPNYTYSIPSRPEVDMNCREVLSYIAQISCLYARISNNGSLVFDWYNRKAYSKDVDGGYFDSGVPKYESGDDVDGGNFLNYSSGDDVDGGTFEDLKNMAYIINTSSSNVHTDDIAITGIRVLEESDVGYNEFYGEETYVLVIKDNPFITSKNAKAVADYVGSRIVGMFFRPFNASALNDVSIEAGDACIVQDFRGNKYYSFITNLSFSVWNYENFSCGAESPSRNKTVRYSEDVKTAVQIRRETQEKISNYDKAVQNMNQLAGNALGYHTTYEELPDGSRVTYLHDKPKLSESKIVYKQTIDGFFISQDGGKTYTAGFDSNGNVIVNILYAIGINADWIRTGVLNADLITAGHLTADRIRGGVLTIGGINDSRGIIEILDRDGMPSGKIHNLGYFSDFGPFSFALSHGASHISFENNNLKRELYYFCSEKLVESKIEYTKKDGDTYDVMSNIESWIDENGYCHMRFSYVGKNAGSSAYMNIVVSRTGSLLNVYEIETYEIKIGSLMTLEAGSIKLKNTLYDNTVSISGSGISSDKMSINAALGQIMASSSAKIGGFGSGNIGVYIYESGIDTNGGYVFCGTLVSQDGKSRLAKTQNYSDRLLYCYETPTPYFGDIGEATLDENGICYIFIDDIFLETVNTDCNYQVFLQKYGNGDLWVEKRTPSYFIAKGTPNLSFAWEIKAKQNGYEYERIEKFSDLKKEETIDYESEADLYIKNYYEELMNYEKSNEHDNFDNGRGKKN